MASFFAVMGLVSTAQAAEGLSGQSVRASVEGQGPALSGLAEELVRKVGGLAEHGAQLLSQAGQKAAAGATEAGLNLHSGSAEHAAAVKSSAAQAASALGQSSFSWGGYMQALGILCLLMAGLWLAVWLIRRYGKFNFLPRPGALPRDALVMEAQLPLGPRKGLMVVRFLNRRLLLGVTDQQITLLTEENAHHEPQNSRFDKIMEEAQSAGPAHGGPAAPSA